MSISNLYPNIDPSLSLDFANVKALDPRITFVRTTTATYYGTETAKAEENLLLRSQEFETTWSNVASTDTANTSTAPDGTTTADTVTEDDTLSFHIVSQGVTTNGTVTLSVFAKLGSGSRFLTIGISKDASNSGSATFDLSLGTSTQTQATGTYSAASATITAVAQSFYRCTFTVTTDSVASIRIGLNDTSTPTSANRGFGANYTGDDTSSLILWGCQLEQRSAATAYTPTTTQPITNYIPVLEVAAAGEARFDHNPLTFESLGLLVEEQRTNLILQSEDFGTTWTNTNSSEETNVIVAPNGTLTGDKLIANTVSGQHRLDQTPVSSAGAQTFSVYAKAGGYDFVGLRIGSPGSSFNLSTGAVAINGAGSVGSIQSVGNGWYRCSIVVAAASANDIARINITDASSPSASLVGNDFDGIFIWGAQLEAAAFPTSYIQTVAATVTRNVDVALMTGTNFTSWYAQNDGTVFCEASTFVNTSIARSTGVLAFDPGFFGQGHYIGFVNNPGAGIFITARSRDGVSQVNANGPGDLNTNQFFKFAGVLSNAFRNIVLDGANLNTNSTVKNVPENTHARIGFTQIGGSTLANTLNGHIKKIAYYPQKLSDAQITALTTV